MSQPILVDLGHYGNILPVDQPQNYPLSTVVVLCSRANLHCLVNLATDILTGCIDSFMAVIVGQTNCLKLETHVASAQDIML